MTKLDELLKETNKKAKEEIVSIGMNQYDYKRIPFTSPEMNYCTYGGIPVGKITEFFGEEHGGKTTSALDIVANYQVGDDPRKVLYVDAENTLDYVWATKLGVNVDDLIIYQPKSQSAEDIFQFICDAVDTGEIGLWILDSIGALLSQDELDKDMDEKSMAGISKPLTLFGKKIEMLMNRHNCTGIDINQLRDNFGSMYGGTKTPGGRAWKHYVIARLEFSRGKFLDAKGNELTRGAENPAGNIVQMAMIKNKTCPPARRLGHYTLNYYTGIDYMTDLINIAIKQDIVQQSGAWFTIVDVETGEVLKDKIHGQSTIKEILQNEDNIEILKRVEELVNNELKKL